MHKTLKYSFVIGIGILFSSCAAGPDNTGLEYAPQMYHSTPYEPLTQITDETMGTWLDSNEEDGHGEFYNSNPYNKHTMNMRKPVANTVKRGILLQPDFKAGDDQLAIAAQMLMSPYDTTRAEIIKEGKVLYDRFCEHCHGSKGAGDGLVAEKYASITRPVIFCIFFANPFLVKSLQ